jgi:hypothetical protein
MIGIVTTFSDANFSEYAHQFINSARQYVHHDIKMYLYVDNARPELAKNMQTLGLEESNPQLTQFKQRHKDKDESNFMYGGKRFAHKSYAICHAALNSDVEKLFWFDADTVFQQAITPEYLNKFLPNGTFTCYLGRPGRYTETGFIGYNLKDPACVEFMETYISYYNEDKIYDLPFQTDCPVYDATREQMVAQNKIKATDLTPGMGKSNFNFIHKGFAVHNKGEHKLGKTKRKK